MSLLLLIAVFCTTAQAAKVAIIMDDLGYRQSDWASLQLPRDITFSILPFTPLGKDIAATAEAQQREIMLHMPMESDNGKFPGPGTLTTGMDRQAMHDWLSKALADIPQARGINNHMGSKLTRQPQAMKLFSDWLAAQPLYFVDSRTTVDTRAEKLARAAGVPTLHRHVFLDNQPTPAAMQKQLRRLITLARRSEHAIAIAHPYPETLAFLAKIDQQLAAEGIELVPVSALLGTSLNAGRATAGAPMGQDE